MAEPPRLPTDDTCDGDATRPTGEPHPAPADTEPSLLRRAALKFDVQHLPIDKVFVGGSRRAVNDERLTALVESIERSGLQTPITVRIRENVPDPETGAALDAAHVLVAGLHRLEAYRKLGWRNIPAIVRDCSQLEAELWEIEENLTRSELTADQKAEHTLRLAAVIKRMEEGLEDSDFPKEDKPTTGRGHKGTIQQVAERIGVDQGTVRHRVKKATAAIGESVDLDRDTPDELTRKADKLKATPADHKAERKATRDKEREKAQAPKPAHKEREKTQATKPPRQRRLAAAVIDHNVDWPLKTFDAGMAELTDPEKADLRQHLPDVMNKHRKLADYLGLRSTIAAVDEATSADQPSPFGSK